MKRLWLVGVIAVIIPTGLGAVPGVARADTLNTFAVGGGVATCDPSTNFFCEFPYEHFAFSAHQGLDNITASPSGEVVLREGSQPGNSNGQISFQGPVTCVSTAALPNGQGGIATITFQVTKSTAPGAAAYMTFSVVDSGQGSTAPDEITPAYNLTGGPQDCLLDRAEYLLQPAAQGNIVVSLQSSALGTALQGDWWRTDSAGNLSVLDATTNTWTLVQ